MTESVAVLGIGNVLLGDDAVGPYVVALFEAAYEVPPDVFVVDAGTPGLDLSTFLSNRRAVILIDSVRADAPPGTARVYDKRDLLRAPAGLRTNVHEPALRDTLQALELARRAPDEVILIGIVPEEVCTRAGLSAPVRDAARLVVDEVARQLSRLGVRVVRRVPGAAPAIWWEQAPPGGN